MMTSKTAIALSISIIIVVIVTADQRADAASTCRRDSAAASNQLNNYARVNRKLKAVSSNPADYADWDVKDGEFFACRPDPTDMTNTRRICDVDYDFDNFVEGEGPLADYVDSILMYAVVPIAAAVAMIFIGIQCCCWRYVCCCKFCPCCCKRGCCGKRKPTLATNSCARLGLKQNEMTGSYEYPLHARNAVRICMTIYIVVTLLVIALGNELGNKGLTEAMAGFSDAALPFQRFAVKLLRVASNFGAGMSGNVVAKAIRDFNQTFTSVVDLDFLLEQLRCTVGQVDRLPFGYEVTNTSSAAVFAISYYLANVSNLATPLADGAIDQAYYQTGYNDVLRPAKSVVVDANYIARENASTLSPLLSSVLPTFFSELSTLKDSIQPDLEAIAADVPDAATVSLATTSGSGSLARARNSGIVMDAVERLVLINRLQYLQGNYTALPNWNTTADNMKSYNARVDDERPNTISALLQRIFKYTADIEEVRPAVRGLNDVWTALQNAADVWRTNVTVEPTTRLDWADLQPEIVSTNESSAFLTEALNALGAQVQLIRDIVDISLPCVVNVSSIVHGINESLLAVPDDILGTIDRTVNDLTNGITPVITALDDLILLIEDFTDDVAILNIVNLAEFVPRIEDELVPLAAGASANTTSFIASLSDVATSATAIDTSEITGDLVTYNNTVFDPAHVLSDIFGVEIGAFNEQINDALNALNPILADIIKWHRGYCSSTTSQVCDGASLTCPGVETCLGIGSKRCNTAATTDCTTNGDADCPMGDRCLVDNSRFLVLSNALDAIDPASPDATDTLADLTAIHGAQANVDVSAVAVQLSNFVSEVDLIKESVIAPYSDYVNRMGIVLNYVDMAAPALVTSAIAVSGAAVDVTSFNSEVNSYRPELDSARSELTELNDTEEALVNVRRLLYEDLSDDLDEVSYSRLIQIRDASGASAMLRHFAQTLDSIIQDISTKGTNDMLQITTNVTDSLSDVIEFIYDVEGKDTLPHGSLYYVLTIVDADIQHATDPSNFRVEYNTSNRKYLYGLTERTCVTSACISNEADFLNKESLDTVTADMDRDAITDQPGDGIGIGYSREQLFGMLYLFPALPALCGLLAMLCYCPGRMTRKCSVCCANCSAGLIFVMAPLILIATSIFFPLLLVVNDVCVHTPSVADHLISNDNSVCADLTDGVGNSTKCVVDAEVSNTLTIQFDVPISTTIGSIGSCPSVDPLKRPLDQILEQTNNSVAEAISQILNETENMGDFQPREPLRNDIRNLDAALAGVFATLVNDVRDPLSCPSLSDLYGGAKDFLCCDPLSAVYWMVISWVILGWLMLCCGCGAAILGRKRFTNAPWGPHVIDANQVAPMPFAIVDDADDMGVQDEFPQPVVLRAVADDTDDISALYSGGDDQNLYGEKEGVPGMEGDAAAAGVPVAFVVSGLAQSAGPEPDGGSDASAPGSAEQKSVDDGSDSVDIGAPGGAEVVKPMARTGTFTIAAGGASAAAKATAPDESDDSDGSDDDIVVVDAAPRTANQAPAMFVVPVAKKDAATEETGDPAPAAAGLHIGQSGVQAVDGLGGNDEAKEHSVDRGDNTAIHSPYNDGLKKDIVGPSDNTAIHSPYNDGLKKDIVGPSDNTAIHSPYNDGLKKDIVGPSDDGSGVTFTISGGGA